jgi:hypothetical protein
MDVEFLLFSPCNELNDEDVYHYRILIVEMLYKLKLDYSFV